MRDRTPLRGAIALVAAAWLAGCTVSSGGATTAPSAGASAVTTPSASIDVDVPSNVLDPIVDDAAKRAGVDKAAVTVTAASAETWPNGALGCPEPGVMYTQAVVSGWQVVVQAGGTPYDYRSSGPGRFKLCSSGAGSGGSPTVSGAPG